MATTIIRSINKTSNKIGFILLVILAISAPISTAIANIATYLMLICFLFTGDWRQKMAYCRHPVIIMAILLCLWVLIGRFYSVAPHALWLKPQMAYIRNIIILCSAFYFLHNNDQRQKRILIGVVIGLAANLIAIYLNYFFLPHHPIVFSNANYPAAQTQLLSAILFLLICVGCFASLHKFPSKKAKVILVIIGTSSLVAEIFLNQARTGYLIEFCLIIGFLVYRFRIKGILYATIAIFLLFGSAYVISPIFHHRTSIAVKNVLNYYKHNQNSNLTSAGLRLYFYQTILNISLNKPTKLFVGYGSNSTRTVFKRFYQTHTLPKNFQLVLPDNPHNQYLLFLLENGVIGLALFLGFLLSILATILKTKKPYDAFILTLTIGFTIGCLLNSWLRDFGPSICFLTYIAVFITLGTKEDKYRNAQKVRSTDIKQPGDIKNVN